MRKKELIDLFSSMGRGTVIELTWKYNSKAKPRTSRAVFEGYRSIDATAFGKRENILHMVDFMMIIDSNITTLEIEKIKNAVVKLEADV